MFYQFLVKSAALRAGVTSLPRNQWYPSVQSAANTYLRGHRGPFYDIVCKCHTKPVKEQNIEPATAPGLPPLPPPPPKQDIPVLQLYIAATKEESKRNEAVLRKDEIKVYADGSRIDGHVGAAAVMYKNGVEIGLLHQHMGSQEDYTSYEGELLSLTLAPELVMRASDIEGVRMVTMGGDNQAALKATQPREKPRPVTGEKRRLVDKFHDLIRAVKNRYPQLQVRLSWMAGHADILGQERADKEAKRAARGWFSLTAPSAVQVGTPSMAHPWEDSSRGASASELSSIGS